MEYTFAYENESQRTFALLLDTTKATPTTKQNTTEMRRVGEMVEKFVSSPMGAKGKVGCATGQIKSNSNNNSNNDSNSNSNNIINIIIKQ